MKTKITLKIILKFVFIFLFLISNKLFSQDFSLGFNYSGLLTGNNYESVSFYNLEGEYEFIPNTLSAGLSATISDTRINKSFIKNSPHKDVYEGSFKLGVQAKYFPYLINIDSFVIKPFIGIELGVYNEFGMDLNLNMTINCEDEFFFGIKKGPFYTNLSLGGIIYPEQTLNIIFGLKYQFNYPSITYLQPICSTEEYSAYLGQIQHTEKINLNVLVWNLGFRFNF